VPGTFFCRKGLVEIGASGLLPTGMGVLSLKTAADGFHTRVWNTPQLSRSSIHTLKRRQISTTTSTNHRGQVAFQVRRHDLVI
jgi:hypothetical protein